MSARRSAPRLKVANTVEPSETVTLSRGTVESWINALEQAQRSAICAAPRQVPWTWTGPSKAIECFDSIEHVIRDLRRAAGGES